MSSSYTSRRVVGFVATAAITCLWMAVADSFAVVSDTAHTPAAGAVENAPPVFDVVFAFPEDRDAYAIAVATFEDAGFELPVFTAEFHDTTDACRGHWGLHTRTSDGRSKVDVCYTHERELPQKIARETTLLHELAHAWVAQNLPKEQVQAFLDVRGLTVWEGRETPWGEQGAEHAAEILLWGITQGSRPINVQIEDTDEANLEAAYVVLTTRSHL